MNLLAFRTKLRSMVGNPTIAEVPDIALDTRLNEAVKDITEKYGFHKGRKLSTFPTVPGTSRYTIPADCTVVMKLRYPGGNYALRKRDETWASENQTLADGKPTDYLRERDWLQLFPTPNAIYYLELFYKVDPPDLVADADMPLFPSTWDNGALYLARYKHWDHVGDLAKAALAMNAWIMWVRDKPNEIAEELFADDTEGVQLMLPNRRSHARFDFDEEA